MGHDTPQGDIVTLHQQGGQLGCAIPRTEVVAAHAFALAHFNTDGIIIASGCTCVPRGAAQRQMLNSHLGIDREVPTCWQATRVKSFRMLHGGGSRPMISRAMHGDEGRSHDLGTLARLAAGGHHAHLDVDLARHTRQTTVAQWGAVGLKSHSLRFPHIAALSLGATRDKARERNTHEHQKESTASKHISIVP